jgi:hypothetical protein
LFSFFFKSSGLFRFRFLFPPEFPKTGVSGFSGEDFEPSQAPSHFKGLSNKNVQSTSFKLLQRALETNNNNNSNNYDNEDDNVLDHDHSESALIHSTAKAPRVTGIDTITARHR